MDLWDELLVSRRDRAVFVATVDGEQPCTRVEMFAENKYCVWVRVLSGAQSCAPLNDLRAALDAAEASLNAHEANNPEA